MSSAWGSFALAVAEAALLARSALARHAFTRATSTLGEKGLDFVPEDPARGRVQVEWADVDEVRCDIVREHVRSLTVETKTGERVVMIAADSLGALRTIAAHVGRDRLIDVNAGR